MIMASLSSTVSWRTYRTEPVITRHLLYLLVREGITPALSGALDDRNGEGNPSITARIALCSHSEGTMTSNLSFRAAGPNVGTKRRCSRAERFMLSRR